MNEGPIINLVPLTQDRSLWGMPPRLEDKRARRRHPNDHSADYAGYFYATMSKSDVELLLKSWEKYASKRS